MSLSPSACPGAPGGFCHALRRQLAMSSIISWPLARRFETGEPVRIRDIADEHGIPPRFLVQILLQLKGAGYVASTRAPAAVINLSSRPARSRSAKS